ncbi:PREDICTED: uncharacterized protein LOC101307207 [Fragaria vesca subsp. vesca]
MVLEQIWEKKKTQVHAKLASKGNAKALILNAMEGVKPNEMMICYADEQAYARLCHCETTKLILCHREALDKMGKLSQTSLSQLVFTTLSLELQDVRRLVFHVCTARMNLSEEVDWGVYHSEIRDSGLQIVTVGSFTYQGTSGWWKYVIGTWRL